jgi:hypothetical protein
MTGGAGDIVTKPDGFGLEQDWTDLARVYDLPNGEVGIVVFAKLTVLKSGSMLTHSPIVTPWDDVAVDLDSPDQSRFFDEMLQGSPDWPPKVLNGWLTGKTPLRCGLREGAIVATGYGRIPPEYRDETPVLLKLLLIDEDQSELQLCFQARLDRSIKHRFEREHLERCRIIGLQEREGLYGGTTTELNDRTHVSEDETGASRGGDGCGPQASELQASRRKTPEARPED